MKGRGWKIVLPVLQLTSAVGLWLYVPFQVSNQTIALMKLTPQQALGRHLDLAPGVGDLYFPPLAGRTLYVINFPAYVLQSKVQDLVSWRKTPAIYFSIENRSRRLPVFYLFGVPEAAFFLGVFALWLWVGFRVGRLLTTQPGATRPLRRVFRLVEIAAVLVLATLLLHTCLRHLAAANCTPPEQSIMAFGLMWPALLFTYIGFSLLQEIRKRAGGRRTLSPGFGEG